MRISLITLLGMLGFAIAFLCYSVDGVADEKYPQTPNTPGDVEKLGKEKYSGGRKKGWIAQVCAGGISPTGKYVILAYTGTPDIGFVARLWDVEKSRP